MNATTNLMGVIDMAVAVQFILNGIQYFYALSGINAPFQEPLY